MPVMLADIEVVEYLRTAARDDGATACESCGHDIGADRHAEVVVATRKGPARSRTVWLCRNCVVALHDGGGDRGAATEPVAAFFGAPA